ncbi:STAS domain-containing protein [Candidatus Berkiella cookevillensis]|uniref:Anti-sigma factor antagonist n=1 Tax=Candidatus Berkiella cookevillensis TaxID=437022 RepID=A0A0Q9YM03_9GAMM|nr:STAS domain-containing protein [Candidatus Berkiella cookevillensis]MCS5707907.1 STAS domain-containing protein [Candidatus Berkiella cookevillensis]
MEISQDTVDGKVVVSLSGRIDSTAAVEFEEQLITIIDQGNNVMAVDFLNVQFISSAGLRVLLLAAKKVKPYGGKLHLCNMSKDVREVFDISGFSSIFDIHGSVSDAVQAIKAG